MARSSSRFRAVQESSGGDLLRDFLWFVAHAGIAETALALVIGAMSLFGPDPDAVMPKIIATALAFCGPLLAGALVARLNARDPRVRPARFCWVFGLILVVSAAVWVSGMATGPGMCAGCGEWEKVWRTLFVLRDGSGLLNGDGLLIGCWAPLATLGYSVGAWTAMRS